MCGRFELHTNPAAIALAFGLAHPPAIAPRYNIAPMQDVPVVRTTRSGERELAQVRWDSCRAGRRTLPSAPA